MIPAKADEPETFRFLKPSMHQTYLVTDLGDEVTRPFQVKLYVKFPEADDPAVFTVLAPAIETAADQ